MWYSRENRKFIRTILNLNMAGTTKMICGIRSGFRSKKVKSEFFAVVSILGFSFEVEFQHPARSFIDIYLPTNELGTTLQPTALVHEAYMRLVGSNSDTWENRAHFYGAAAEAMRSLKLEVLATRCAAKAKSVAASTSPTRWVTI